MVSYSTHANSFTIEIKSIPDAGATMSMMKTGMAAGFGIKHTMTMLTNASGNAKEVKRIAWVFAQALKGRRVKMEMLVCAKIISRQCWAGQTWKTSELVQENFRMSSGWGHRMRTGTSV
jgi:hypothetical protein